MPIRLLAALLLLMLPGTVHAQQDTLPETAETRQRLDALRRQIEDDQQRLSQTREAERVSLGTLNRIERQIASREALVGTYRRRMGELSRERDMLASELNELSGQLEYLKRQYRARAIHAYKWGRLHDLALILSAGSINEMVRRARYLHRFAQQRQRRLSALEAAADAVQQRRRQISASTDEARQVVADAAQQQQHLQGLRGERARVVAELRTRREHIEEEIARKRQAADQLEAQIRSVVATEDARRRERGDAAETAAFEALSGSFEQNRGRLPWPSEGVVVEPFGEIVNPATGTRTPNPGVLIATRPGIEVHAVFEGVVSRVDAMPDFGTYILIQHGDYQSLYSNFSSVTVRTGMHVAAGQVIGRTGTAAQPRGAGIFFALFHKGATMNPQPWLRNR